jgi:hypothetical protein
MFDQPAHAILHRTPGQPASDEPGPAGDEQTLHWIPILSGHGT